MSDQTLAQSYPMDIPHVTAVELPLAVKHVDRAIAAIGGKKKIADAINHGEPLELRLRKDPFHHPVMASTSSNERILLRVSIPKSKLAARGDHAAQGVSVRDLIKLNDDDPTTPKTKIKPVAIVDKTYRFRAMSDFQVNTKNNEMVQQFNQHILNCKNYTRLKRYIGSHHDFQGLLEWNETYFQNNDHGLIPPPILSPIRFPFDYNYKKNRITTSVKDEKSGQVKMVSTNVSIKLHTKIIDHSSETPMQPAFNLLKNREAISKSKMHPHDPSFLLIQCIEWTERMFEMKPVWIRKHLYDLAPEDLKKYLKLALPYVTYIFRSGPWRFCNLKLGVDPRSDSKYWIYQSEYFRVPGVTDSSEVSAKGNIKRITPRSLEKASEQVEIAQNLFFDGVNLPTTSTYQLGDILDPVITSIYENDMKEMGKDFLRRTWDLQDGWVNARTMNLVRKIVRYKLNQLVKEEPIDQGKVYAMVDSVKEEAYGVKEDPDNEVEGEADGADVEEEEIDEENNEDDEVETEIAASDDIKDDAMEVDEEDVLARLQNLNDDATAKLRHVLQYIKQDDLDDSENE
ncbi:uncharacterized protein LODBEIA_P48540 [Lodderomyces beijingensis]|uniref:Transcription factor IIIC subunit 5 HTH domain-containing protein n=1 Tax=Lodderomyces beijingensis TaxID=1775926 RepID=A0ABP0ZR47_9ASCO